MGSVVWAILSVSLVRSDKGEPLYFTSQITDISVQKKAQQDLEKTLSQLEGLLEASTQVSIIGTDREGVVTTFNKGAENLLGYHREEVLLIQTPALIHLEEEIISRGTELSDMLGKRVQGFDVFVELANVEKFETREWTYVKKDGTQFPVLLTVTAVRESNEIVGYMGVAVDISEIKRVEKEIKSLLDVTKEQNDRLKNFTHIVSHNLRSHSGNISILLDLMAEETPVMLENEMFRHLQSAAENLKQTIAHLNEVVLMSNAVANNLTGIDLATTTQGAIQNVAALAKTANVVINNHVGTDCKVMGVAAYMESIILNLLTNAIKYRSDERDGYVTLTTSTEGNYLVLTIEDNGIGMNLSKIGAKLFGMYKTFHGNKDARGIGLFITKNQVEAMGGKIEVESEVNVGTTFKVYLKNEKN